MKKSSRVRWTINKEKGEEEHRMKEELKVKKKRGRRRLENKEKLKEEAKNESKERKKIERIKRVGGEKQRGAGRGKGQCDEGGGTIKKVK